MALLRSMLLCVLLSSAGCDRAGAATTAPASRRPADLYELSTEGSTGKLKVGERGKLVVRIKPKDRAHVTAPNESPLRITFSAPHVKPDAPELRYVNPKDLKKSVGEAASAVDDLTFEMPFVAEKPASAEVHAEVTFLICLEDTLCARQKRQLAIPVDVL